MLLAFNSLIMKVISPSKQLESPVFKFFGFYPLIFDYTQLKIVVLSGGGKNGVLIDWRVESDIMIFCEWLVEEVNGDVS